MPREKREILKEDIIPLDVYTKNRKELRKNIVTLKKIEELHLAHMLLFILKVMKQCWLKFKRCFTLKKVEMNN